jgi:hypothetical protein
MLDKEQVKEDIKTMSIIEVARKHGVTRQRIGQIVKSVRLYREPIVRKKNKQYEEDKWKTISIQP